MTRWFLVGFLACSGALRAASLDTAEAGVVEIPATVPNEESAWKPVEDARGTTRFVSALDSWLTAHPHGVMAARALYEQALLQENLLEAGATLRRARGEGQGTVWGTRASLELAKLEYAQERAESALMALEDAETWTRPEELEPEWLYWRGQSRLVLKGFERAKADFERLVASYGKHTRGQAALLGLAECDAALKLDDKALAGFEGLYKDPANPLGAQALWGAAALRQRQGDLPKAKALLARLRSQYPASFEAGAAKDRLAEIAKLPVEKPVAVTAAVKKGGHILVQVGAFSKQASALKLQKKLKARRYPAKVHLHKHVSRSLYHVEVGPYKDRRSAEAAAKKLETQDHLQPRITEE